MSLLMLHLCQRMLILYIVKVILSWELADLVLSCSCRFLSHWGQVCNFTPRVPGFCDLYGHHPITRSLGPVSGAIGSWVLQFSYQDKVEMMVPWPEMVRCAKRHSFFRRQPPLDPQRNVPFCVWNWGFLCSQQHVPEWRDIKHCES